MPASLWGLPRHPGYRRLNRYADGELTESERSRVAAHLERCERCRREVAFIHRAGEVARSLRTRPASDSILRQALARRQSGERVLLPWGDMGEAPARGRVAVPAIVAALLVLLIGSLVVSVRVLEADRPGLHVAPERPRAGARLSVEYRAPQLFADAPRLKLRARYRSASHASWQLLAGVLVRGDDGVYRARVSLPDSVVYAAFAVEDLSGERLDSRNRRLWEVLVHGGSGRPTLAALGAQAEDLLPRDWGAAYRTAIRMTELYPDAPQAWLHRLVAEQSLFDPDSLDAAYRARYRALERATLADPDAGDQLAWLAGLAITLGDPAGARRALDRAARDPAPASPIRIRSELLVEMLAERREPPALLPTIEGLWRRHGFLPPEAIRTAVITASRAGDPVALERWVERYLRLGYEEPIAPYLTPMLGRLDPSLLDRLEAHHRAILDPANEGRRPLRFTVPEYARHNRAALQRVLTPLAALAGASGRAERAATLAAEAAELSWDTRSLERLGDVLLEAGDTASATVAYARAAADPLGAGPPPSVRRAAGWEPSLALARVELESYVMEGAVVRYPDGEAEVEAGGRVVRLASLLGGRPLVMVFTSPYSAPAIRELYGLGTLEGRVDSARADLVVVLLGADDPAGVRMRARLAGAVVVTDPEGDLQSTFQSSATPNYFVLDAAGRIRFEHSSLEEVPRQLAVLRNARSFPTPLTD